MMEKYSNHTIAENHLRYREKGISTVQIAIGIMVSVIVLLGAIGGYQYAYQSKVNNEVLALTHLKLSTVRYAVTFKSLNGLNISTMNDFGFWNNPAFTYDASPTPKVNNQWGGTIIVDFPTFDSVRFSYTLVPSNVCKDFGQRLDPFTMWIQVGQNDEFVKSRNSPTNVNGSGKSLASECDLGGSTPKTMKFTFTM